MNAHTPGPWTVEIQAEPEGDEPVVYVCHAGTVCDVTTVCNLLPSSAASVEQRQANARLIAATPDLLRELEKSTGILIALRDHLAGAVTPKVLADIDERIAAGEVAIAKAKG